MNRRDLIALLGGTAVRGRLRCGRSRRESCPQSGLWVRVRLLPRPMVSRLPKSAPGTGWIEGRTINIEYRWAEDRTSASADRCRVHSA